MEVSTLNVILAFIGSAILFVVGIIVGYVRQINRNTMETKGVVTEHKTEIRNVKDRINKLEDKVYER